LRGRAAQESGAPPNIATSAPGGSLRLPAASGVHRHRVPLAADVRGEGVDLLLRLPGGYGGSGAAGCHCNERQNRVARQEICCGVKGDDRGKGLGLRIKFCSL